ncbi:mannitol dehydrogenase family protein [Pseudooceanicola sp.]|uniref:mannitol dehydrogenase family protein n=1 Tax=Pseudooceanicola sp. TaxID=1914328 RepID=UPI0035C7010B
MPADPAATYPRFSRSAPTPKIGIVHLGPGAFFRAFNAVYTDEAMTRAGGDWGILAVSLQSPTARDQLDPQGGAYQVVTLGPEGETPQPVNAIARVLVAPEDPAAVIAAMANPAVRIVSLTITEKGYRHAPATGRLNLDDPDVAHDLAHPEAPVTAVGFIVTALARRRTAGARPFTVQSCDNLPDNGHLARGIVLDFARALDPDLADWIAAKGRFPSSMVDRITPATTPEDLDRLAARTRAYDAAAVFCEPFRQWVIEDDFVDGARPAWQEAGAQMVRDVAAHEAMKLRCLNGTHSTLAYLGYLAGFETIAETVTAPGYDRMLLRLWRDEILPTVAQPEGEDLQAYCDALLARYRNPAIRHRTWQIAMDGSQKLPQRLLGTLAETLAAGRPAPGLILAVAGWMRYMGGVDDAGREITLKDPLAGPLKSASDAASTAADKVAAFLAFDTIFPADLAATPGLAEALTRAYEDLATRGAHACVKDYANG